MYCFIIVDLKPQKSFVSDMTDGGVTPSVKFMAVLEPLMWQLRGLSKSLLEIIRSKCQSLPGWTLDLELLCCSQV